MEKIMNVSKKIYYEVSHIIYPNIERILPPGHNRRIAGGKKYLFLGTIPVIIKTIIWIALLFIGVWLLKDVLFNFIILLKFDKIFKFNFINKEFFNNLGLYFNLSGLFIILLFLIKNILSIYGTSIYITKNEIIIIKRLLFRASVSRILIKKIRNISFKQFFGERILKTGTIEIYFDNNYFIELNNIPDVESIAAHIIGRNI